MRINAYFDRSEPVSSIGLVSCGHIFAKEGRQISRPGGREDWLLFYVAKGREEFFLSGSVVAEPGSFILFRPFERQEHICISQTAEFYYVHFQTSEMPISLKTSAVYHTKPSATICGHFEDILREAQFKDTNYSKICTYKLLELLAKLERKVIDAAKPHREHFDKIAQSVTLLHREYMHGYPLEYYADICCMSKYHYLRIFKSVVGISPMEYRNTIRMNHAKEMLEETGLTVAEIGASVGFSSPSCFCDAFKRQFGISPAKYRQSCR